MSRKPKTTIRPLPDRIAKARKEGRTQQALELTRTLVKHEPSEAHRELLRHVTLERGQQLQAQGSWSDAATVYQHALTLGGSTEYLAQVIQRLAACGGIAPALQALAQLTDPAVRQRVLCHAVDAAVAKGPSGKNALPLDLHAGFDLTQQAFAHYEAGRDEEARAALQGIGLQSPFLEWKVLLRGLLAFLAKDDARALENWGRLDQARLPARLAAPLRASIDRAFLAAQPPAIQQSLRTKWMQQQGLTIAPALRDIKELLAGDDLRSAFHKAEAVVAVLARDHRDLVPRLAQCFFWAVIERGNPEDLEHYLRVFGAPVDDPNLNRLEALALEARGMWPEAHRAWQDLIEQISKNPAAWPDKSAPRVQALIWARMANNAAFKNHVQRRSGNPFFDLFAAHPAPLKPGVEQCLENAIKLAPDRLDSYRALFACYCNTNKLAKAKKVGKQLLERFPDHGETLTELAAMFMETRNYKAAQDYFEKAMQANPLDRGLRLQLARAKQSAALALTLESKYDKARVLYEQAVQLRDGANITLRTEWAVCELKANNPARAEELIAQASAEPDHQLACRYALVSASVRAGLSTKEKKQFVQDLKAALAQTPTPAALLTLIEIAAHQHRTHDAGFHGQKTHEKTILKFLDRLEFSAFDQTQLAQLCLGLNALQARKPWLHCLNHARRHFPKSPFFRLSYADYYLGENTRDPKTHLAREHLDAARRLAEEMPRGEEQQQLLEQIMTREEIIAELSARRGSLADLMGGAFGPEDDDFFDDEDDDDWY